jgi:hypothetical protein
LNLFSIAKYTRTLKYTMGDSAAELDKAIKNPYVVAFYFALLLVLVVLCLYWCKAGKSERFLGDGTVMSAAPYTSGATMRRLGQDFSSTNQGEYTTVHNDELKELVPGLIKGPAPAVAAAVAAKKKERLVNERGFPDFWEISNDLSAYKDETAAGFQADVAAGNTGAEYMTGSDQDQVQLGQYGLGMPWLGLSN